MLHKALDRMDEHLDAEDIHPIALSNYSRILKDITYAQKDTDEAIREIVVILDEDHRGALPDKLPDLPEA